MSKALSLVCFFKANGSVPCIELHYPTQIEQVAELLERYKTPEQVETLIAGGDIEHMTKFDIAQTGQIAPHRKTATRSNVCMIAKDYPYAYMYNEQMKQWYFCHVKTENYHHPNAIPLNDALNLQKEGRLFQFDI